MNLPSGVRQPCRSARDPRNSKNHVFSRVTLFFFGGWGVACGAKCDWICKVSVAFAFLCVIVSALYSKQILRKNLKSPRTNLLSRSGWVPRKPPKRGRWFRKVSLVNFIFDPSQGPLGDHILYFFQSFLRFLGNSILECSLAPLVKKPFTSKTKKVKPLAT